MPMQAYRRGRGIALPLSILAPKASGWSKPNPGHFFPPGDKPFYPLYRRLSVPQDWHKKVCRRENILPQPCLHLVSSNLQ